MRLMGGTCLLFIISLSLIGCSKDQEPQPKKPRANKSDPGKQQPAASNQGQGDNPEGGKKSTGAVRLAEYVPADSLAAVVVRPADLLSMPGMKAVGQLWERLSYTNTDPLKSRTALLRGVGFQLSDVEQAIYVVDSLRMPKRVPQGPQDDSARQATFARSLYGLFADAYILRFSRDVPEQAVSALLFHPRQVNIAGHTYYGQGKDADTAAACAIDSRTILFGSERVVRKMLSQSGPSSPYQQAVAKAAPANGVVFLLNVSVVKEQVGGAMENPQMKAMFESIHLAELAIDLQPEVTVRLRSQSVDAEKAQQAKAVVEQLLAVAKRNLPPADQVRDPIQKELIEISAAALASAKLEWKEKVFEARLADFVKLGQLTTLVGTIHQKMDQIGRTQKALASLPAEEDAAAIRARIPMAAAMSTEMMQEIAVSASIPNPSQFKNQPLSLVVLTMPATSKDVEALNPGMKNEFGFNEIDGRLIAPRPSELASAMTRSAWLGGCTIIQPEFITDFACDIDGDTAAGTVNFDGYPYLAGPLYQGKVAYKAKRQSGLWQIVEFQFPVRKWKFTLSEDGAWVWTTPLGVYGQETMGDVEMKVILDGKPLTAGTVHFQHAESPGHRFLGRINREGDSSMKVPSGKYRVVITGPNIPEKYQSATVSDLRCEVKPGENAINFSLISKD